ncbi:alpha/beta hydrolase [Photobacterium sp. WH77]|nr:alpha/beta hydrolase [Photobacterium sp. WH80]MCG2836986.1 alpha/beta hydrolase [Photobacterium sp. WH77]
MNRILALILIFTSSIGVAGEIVDHNRNRIIPVEISFPPSSFDCSIDSKCPVIFLSTGYSVSHTKYQFLTDLFSELGYLVVAIGHELPSDPPLSVSGNLFETRSENWMRGSQTLKVVRQELQAKYPEYSFNSLVLVGHSNGGDISAWLTRESPSYVSQIITLDHRRVPLPRTKDIKVLSVRASDFEADDGVLLTNAEQVQYVSCIIKIPNARHNDMTDYGPIWLKSNIQQIVRDWLDEASCELSA